MKEFGPNLLSGLPLHHALSNKAEALARGGSGRDQLERERAAQEFASLLYLEVLKAMRATLPKDGLFEDDSLSRDIYNSMLDTELARVLAKRDTTGFTRSVRRAIDTMAPSPAAESAPVAPVTGTVSSTFGERQDPIHGGKRFHNGIDIAAPAGSEVRAPVAGRVTFSGMAQGYGNLVEIDHGDGTLTRYAHNATNLVNAGDVVGAGQPIAIVGSTGRATGAHLHFEVRQGGKPVDPSFMLGGGSKGTKLSSII